MGMKIFEQSGSFSPADYGLVAGDVLDIICVGGGEAGEFATGNTPKTPAGESSFGAYLSSADGIRMAHYASDGCGAGGYMPGVPFYGGNGGDPVGLAGTIKTPVSPYCNTAGDGNKGATGRYAADAPGGNGYGAGSGGGYDPTTTLEGGDAGKIAFGSVVLAGTAAIAVTVGAGGTNGYKGNQLVGAPGVVIVFW